MAIGKKIKGALTIRHETIGGKVEYFATGSWRRVVRVALPSNQQLHRRDAAALDHLRRPAHEVDEERQARARRPARRRAGVVVRRRGRHAVTYCYCIVL